MDNKARDKRLQRTYGISLVEYNTMLQMQDEACGICKTPAKNFSKSLHVDHDHKLRYEKIFAGRFNGVNPETDQLESGWVAVAAELPFNSQWHKTKSAAIQDVRLQLKRASVRGLICFRCNAGLQKFSDNPTRLANAAEYLRRYNGKLGRS